jgi:hypothetical protein
VAAFSTQREIQRAETECPLFFFATSRLCVETTSMRIRHRIAIDRRFLIWMSDLVVHLENERQSDLGDCDVISTFARDLHAIRNQMQVLDRGV